MIDVSDNRRSTVFIAYFVPDSVVGVVSYDVTADYTVLSAFGLQYSHETSRVRWVLPWQH